AAMNEGDARAVTPEVERRDGRGILAADDDDIEAVVGVGLVVVVLDLAEVLAGNTEVVGQVVVAGGDDELAGAVGDGPGEVICCVDGKITVRAGDAFDRFILTDVEGVVLGNLAV